VICFLNFLEYRSTKAWTIRGCLLSAAAVEDSNGEDVEPIIKVLPKPALADLFLKVSIVVARIRTSTLMVWEEPRRSNSLCWIAGAAWPAPPAAVPDLVETKGGTMGDFEPAYLPGIGPGKCAFSRPNNSLSIKLAAGQHS